MPAKMTAMNRIVLMPAPNELFSHPLRWVGKHLAFYALAATVAGAIFIAGSALYACFAPAPIRIEPSTNDGAVLPAPVAPLEQQIRDLGYPELVQPPMGEPGKKLIGDVVAQTAQLSAP
jgi:hypothetical protein